MVRGESIKTLKHTLEDFVAITSFTSKLKRLNARELLFSIPNISENEEQQ